MKGICQDTPILGSFADYRKKGYIIAFTLGLKAYTYKGRFSIESKGAVISPILDCKYSTVEQKFLWPRETNFSIH